MAKLHYYVNPKCVRNAFVENLRQLLLSYLFICIYNIVRLVKIVMKIIYKLLR